MKRNGKEGFLLIEWIVHFLLMSIFLLIVAELVISFHRNVIFFGRLCDNFLSVHLAADALRADIRNAQSVALYAKGLRIEHGDNIQFWEYDGKAVWRQKIACEQGSWSKSCKSLFAQHVAQSNFVIKSATGPFQTGVLIEWHVNGITFFASMRNGLII